jgi:hypothetical protein
VTDDISFRDVLFDDGVKGQHRVVRQLLALPTAGGWLAGLTIAQRAVSELELAQQLTAVLHFDIGELILRSWLKLAEVKSAAATSREHPGDLMVVPLAAHMINGSKQPVIEIYAGTAKVARFELEAKITMELRGVELKLGAGRITSVASGSWSATASVSCFAVPLATRRLAERGLPNLLPEDGVDVLGDTPAPMLRLILEPAPCSGDATVVLNSSLVIGRHPSCGVVLCDDPDVADHHVGIHTVAGVVVLEDLGSATGTYYNGRRINAPAVLRSGDNVRIGSRDLRVA